MKILDGYGIEVAIPSIASPMDTSYVVISRETERFVNEIHDHEEELKCRNELLTELQGSVKSEPYEERKGSSRNKETVLALSAIRLQEHPCIHKEPFLHMRGNGRSSCALTRWMIFGVIMTQMKDKLMFQDIGICESVLHDKNSRLCSYESFRRRPEEEEPHFDCTISLKVHCETCWKKQSRCGKLDKIVKGAGSRIAILANKIICNHNPRHSSRRLH